MSRGKGNAAPAWVAAYLTRWWPSAEKTPNGRPGRDILGTPGVAIEVKTGAEWRHKWIAQSAGHAATDDELPFIVYLPPGLGGRSVADSLAVLPLRVLMPLLVAAGYAPAPFRQNKPAELDGQAALFSPDDRNDPLTPNRTTGGDTHA